MADHIRCALSAGPVTARASRALALAMLAAACSAPADRVAPFSATDEAAIHALDSAYVTAWLRSDTAGVLALFDSSAVLVPPGREAMRGLESIREYWWPRGGAPFAITRFESTIEEIDGRQDLAYTRGRSTVGWSTGQGSSVVQQVSTNLSMNILHRGPDGRWHILRHTWGPPLRTP